MEAKDNFMNFKVDHFKLLLKQAAVLAVFIPFSAHSMFVELPEVPGSHIKTRVFQASSLKRYLQGESKELKEACLQNQALLTTLTQSVGLGEFYFEPIEDFPRFLSEVKPMLLLHEMLESRAILPFEVFSLTYLHEGKTEEKFIKASLMIRGTKLSYLKGMEKKSAWEKEKSINLASFSDIFLDKAFL